MLPFASTDDRVIGLTAKTEVPNMPHRLVLVRDVVLQYVLLHLHGGCIPPQSPAPRTYYSPNPQVACSKNEHRKHESSTYLPNVQGRNGRPSGQEGCEIPVYLPSASKMFASIPIVL